MARRRPAGSRRSRAWPTCCALLGPLTDADDRPRPVDASGAPRRSGRRSRRPAVRSGCGSPARSGGAAVEDAARLRDALGVPVPPGVPDAFTEPVADPLGDLVGPVRPHARSVHHAADVAGRLRARAGGRARRSAAAGRGRAGRRGRVPTRRRTAASGATPRCCAGCVAVRWPRCARRSSRSSRPRSAASCRPGSTSGGRLRGAEGVLWSSSSSPGARCRPRRSSRILPAARAGLPAGLLDELTAAGEVIWAGAGSLPGHGRLGLPAPRRRARPLTLPDRSPSSTSSDRHERGARRAGGRRRLLLPAALRRGRLDRRPGARPRRLWDLVWAGHLTNDTLAPLRSFAVGRGTHRPRRRATRRTRPPRRCAATHAAGRPAGPRRAADGRPAAGRCSRPATPTRPGGRTPPPRLCSSGTASSPAARWSRERMPGGFAAVYRVLSAFEESGRGRRGYFVAGLGAAQFAPAGAVDRLRAIADTSRSP